MTNWFSKWEYQCVLSGVFIHPYLINNWDCDTIYFFSNLVVKIILWALFMNYIWFPQEYQIYFQYTSEIRRKQPFRPHPSLFSRPLFAHLFARRVLVTMAVHASLSCTATLLLTPLQKQLSKFVFVSSPCMINPKVTMNEYLVKQMEVWNLSQ